MGSAPSRSSSPIAGALAAACAATGRALVVDRPLPGGWNEGAWLVGDGDGRAVLKLHTRLPERVIAAAPRIEAARARGWPTPAWLALGQLDDAVWVLQVYVDGRRPERLDERVAAGLIEALEVQRGLGDGSGGWGEWACGVVFEDWTGYRARIAGRFPRGGEIVRLVDAIAGECAGLRPREDDVVHGNFNLGNVVAEGDRLWLVDAHGIGPGPVEYDLAELVLLAAVDRVGDDDALDLLWRWGVERLDVRHLAVCAGSLALTTADAFDRLGRLGEASLAAPGTIATLERALALVR